MTEPALPYGPETPAIRRFLVRLAGLGASDRSAMVATYEHVVRTRDYEVAESALAHAIERSGRESARDALSGPLLQLVRAPTAPGANRDPEALDPVAEPALAALLALLVRDLLDPVAFDTLYGACADRIPLHEVLTPHAR